MERTFKITVDGRAYSVTVEELTEIANSNHLNNHADGAAPARSALAVPSLAPVSLAPAQANGPAEPGDVVSSLGGVIDSVQATVGQDVKEGDRLLVLEAMKMKTPVNAHRAGKVADVLVKAGDGVQAGQVLVKLS